MSTEIVKRENQMPSIEDGSLLQVIANAVADPRMDVEKMGKLLDLQERIIADQRKTAFFAALARLTPKLPEIPKNGQSHHGKYSRLEDIDRLIRPLIAAEGFSMSFDSIPVDGKVRVSCRLAHENGHSETKQIDLPLDTSGSKNGAQSVISTVSYGRRALIKMFFNLIEGGEDLDGNDPATISEEQAVTLLSLMDEVKADKVRFLQHMKVAGVNEILARDYKKAIELLEQKRRAQK